MQEVVVTKRDGSREDYDVSKIKKSIAFCTDGIDVSPLMLESKIDVFLKNGMKTSDIQANIIQHAIQFASASQPQWLKVAGKAKAMDMSSNFKLRDKSFYEVIKYNIKKKKYSPELLTFYTKEQIDELGAYIKHIRDENHSIASLVTVEKKYLGEFEMHQHMHMVSAMRFGQFETEDERVQFVKETYDVLSNRELSLATPFMSNLRKGGNVASCFILALDDDLDSIYDNIKRIARISKNGGGLGIYLGYLRAKGSSVGGHKNAAGSIVQWVKVINDTLVAVNQNGLRAGAGTVALPIWHNDILDFLDMQTESGDIRQKCYDVFPQITIPDVYMERDRDNQEWYTFCPFEVRTTLGIDVRELHGPAFKEAYLHIESAIKEGKLSVFQKFDSAKILTKIFMRRQFETGLPYCTFIDTVNNVNPNANDGSIPCTNLCTESFSNVKPDVYGHVCNLASINLGNIKDMDRLAFVSKLATKILDYGISLTNNPDPITASHNTRYRTIGIGIMGLHDYLAREHKTFADLEHISEIAECIEFNAVVQSAELAKKYGSFDAFDVSRWKSGEMTCLFNSRSGGKYDWDHAQQLIDQFGMRNSQLTSPAPTTSTSIYQDASATWQPVYSAFFSEDNKNGSMKVAARYLDKNPLGYGKNQSKFTTNEIIDIVASLQKFIDTGISMELIFDQNKETFSAKDLYDAIHYAWASGIKSIYYIRSIKKNASLGKTEEACESCAG